jgi:rSAM/selenodomain-associated transferase 2
MISVVIPTLDAEEDLGRTLAALVPAAVEGLVREVIVADGGSRDRTLEIADHAGAEIAKSEPGRGHQLRAGAARARFPWLLFLHADTVLDAGWERDAEHLIERVESGRMEPRAAAFRFTLDDLGFAPRTLETLVHLRNSLLSLPYGDQGLLIPRRLYDEIGGYAPLPVMEDVDIVRRLGRRRLVMLRSRAVTSAVRYRRDGYVRRVLRNQWCLALYFLNVPASTIARIYGARRPPAASPLPRASAQ